jgi:hypothetical protein
MKNNFYVVKSQGKTEIKIPREIISAQTKKFVFSKTFSFDLQIKNASR